MKSYCLKCKTETDGHNEIMKQSANGRNMSVSECDKCGTKKCKFMPGKVDQSGSGIESSKFASEAYKGQNKRAETVDGYKLDKSLSNRNIAVYKNDAGQAYVANRGTDLSRGSTRMQDLKNDALILVGKSPKDRVNKTVNLTKKIQAEGFDVTNVGHSLGSNIAANAAQKTGTKAEVYSIGSSALSKKQKANSDITSYRVASDPIALSARNQGITKENDNIIRQTASNPHTLQNFINVADQKSQQTGSGLLQYTATRKRRSTKK